MKIFKSGSYRILRPVFLLILISMAADTFAQNEPFMQHYKRTNLVSDIEGIATVTDPNLVNPWGLSRGSATPWWVADNGTGVSTLYSGTGSIVPLVVTIPTSDPKGQTGNPTGTVYNGGTGFEVKKGFPAVFLFVTEDGTISGWNPSVNQKRAIIKVNEKENSIFKGATIATINVPSVGAQSYLYAADFRQGRLQIYDSNFQHVPAMEAQFNDDQLPAGFAPFNVQNIGGNIFVAYAMQDSDKEDEVAGAGLGYVDVFSPQGKLLLRLQHGPWFNAPWGLVQASSDFGTHSHDILVGQFGSGQILSFNAVTGKFKGWLRNTSNQNIKIDGLWALSFGNDGPAGPATTLYFTAGPDHEQHGLFGTIVAIENIQGNGQ